MKSRIVLIPLYFQSNTTRCAINIELSRLLLTKSLSASTITAAYILIAFVKWSHGVRPFDFAVEVSNVHSMWQLNTLTWWWLAHIFHTNAFARTRNYRRMKPQTKLTTYWLTGRIETSWMWKVVVYQTLTMITISSDWLSGRESMLATISIQSVVKVLVEWMIVLMMSASKR